MAAHAQTEPSGSKADGGLRFVPGEVMLEYQSFSRAPQAKSGFSLRAAPSVAWQPGRQWELRFGVQLDADGRSGGYGSFDRLEVELGETFVRYRSGDLRLSAGLQKVVWGRVDAVPLIDRVSRADLSRFVSDDLAQRRRAQPMFRLEQQLGELKVDAIVMPRYRAAILPPVNDIWSPIDPKRGRLLGLEPSPGLSALVRSAGIDSDSRGFGGAALRVTGNAGDVDWGVVGGRTRQPLPYYRVDLRRPALTAIHPLTSFVGLDAESATESATWRMELVRTAGVTVTRPDSRALTTGSTEAVVGVEFFPGGRDTRVTLQWAGRWIAEAGPILELRTYTGLNGGIETSLDQGRWKIGLTFFSGLNVHDLYVSPKVTYTGWEPHQIYVAAQYFDGSERTVAGFHRDHRSISIGARLSF